jgi:hypothetical protein
MWATKARRHKAFTKVISLIVFHFVHLRDFASSWQKQMADILDYVFPYSLRRSIIQNKLNIGPKVIGS